MDPPQRPDGTSGPPGKDVSRSSANGASSSGAARNRDAPQEVFSGMDTYEVAFALVLVLLGLMNGTTPPPPNHKLPFFRTVLPKYKVFKKCSPAC